MVIFIARSKTILCIYDAVLYFKNLNINTLIYIHIILKNEAYVSECIRKQNLNAIACIIYLHITKIWRENVKLKYIVTINVS